jgi:hypothetical protein
MSLKKIAKTLLSASFVLLLSGRADSQAPVQDDATIRCGQSGSITKKEGWTIPGLKGSKVKQHATLENLKGVFLTMLEPGNAESSITYARCSQTGTEIEEKADIPIKVIKLWSYDFGGRVFAYRVEFSRETIQNGVRGELGGSFRAFYYDMDGSGRFTVVKFLTTISGSMIPAFIPDWAKNSSETTKH